MTGALEGVDFLMGKYDAAQAKEKAVTIPSISFR